MASPEPPTIPVEVAYARADVQVILPLEVALGTTAREAVIASGIAQRFSEIDPERADIGVFGKAVKDDHPLHTGDRVEVYRPLIADPKQVRKERAAAGKKTRRGAGQGD
jgi:putative ubiquitin-RnfH superfamily antitoxin RatB of RatAB toxin-antitoxin module